MSHLPDHLPDSTPANGGYPPREISVWRPADGDSSLPQPVQAWTPDRRRATRRTARDNDRRRREVETNSLRIDNSLLDLRLDPKTTLADRVGIDVTDVDGPALYGLVSAEAFLLAANGIEWVALGGFGTGDCLLQLRVPRSKVQLLCLDADPVRRTR